MLVCLVRYDPLVPLVPLVFALLHNELASFLSYPETLWAMGSLKITENIRCVFVVLQTLLNCQPRKNQKISTNKMEMKGSERNFDKNSDPYI